jgi:hypothetical protein
MRHSALSSKFGADTVQSSKDKLTTLHSAHNVRQSCDNALTYGVLA